MKFLTFLVLILVSINNFYLSSGKSVISIKTFQYDQYRCRDDSSGLGPMSTGSFATDERILNLGNIDGGNSQSASWSSSVEDCDNSEIENEFFVVVGECLPMDGDYYYYYTYRVDYTNGTISKTAYSDDRCETFSRVEHFKIDECVKDCKLSGPYLFTIIDSSEIVIPKNTLVVFDYTGECSGNWKQTFTTIRYTPINRCLLTGENTAYQITCNSTNFNEFYSYNQNNCIRYSSEIEHRTGVQYCKEFNQQAFCNV
ncbi:hypothetical protein DDB_G0276925 [Dictyostelium discoideum AX4]|uniref:Uncharacterized protein n=1 Tax=Dictyostelium discoideum TaxID=44689 RepID=Q86KQ6_DICDI|nr:hypothetical protein DDB_G0276925 [Dictyostelium discoideum AX4]EAL68964.1 hypothetical protein DDB_G0276925 [Dictyostelium discoideum AX4]|eukprot:XP_642810.1 hypothetical protein DDB_G0276925 [Dictyostelium discoideum AX4]